MSEYSPEVHDQLTMIRAKAAGACAAFERMSSEERRLHLSQAFGENLNYIIQFIGRTCPRVGPFLPSQIKISNGGTNAQTYEVWACYSQIVSLIDSELAEKRHR